MTDESLEKRRQQYERIARVRDRYEKGEDLSDKDWSILNFFYLSLTCGQRMGILEPRGSRG